ncbi:MAG: hypothetical protein KAT06_10670 [Gammaproteobacteria bacterium]|nr:hypothetical protein [Gammaproteobacteria bacterium]
MSDSLLSFTIIFAELGGVLLLVVIGWVIYFFIGVKKDGRTTKELIHRIKAMIPAHRDQLVNYFKNELELGKNKIDFNVETLVKDERKIYDRLIKVSITKDISLLKLTTEDINSLVNNYVRLLALKAEKDSDNSKESTEIKLKKENDALCLDNASLQKRLTDSLETIENMMSEFSSMYEGGKKEGEQRVKNEMYKLKQSLKTEEVRVESSLNELDEKEGDNKEE